MQGVARDCAMYSLTYVLTKYLLSHLLAHVRVLSYVLTDLRTHLLTGLLTCSPPCVLTNLLRANYELTHGRGTLTTSSSSWATAWSTYVGST
jgi:hypothetical protein